MPSPRDLFNEFRQNETRDMSEGEVKTNNPIQAGLLNMRFT